MIRRTGTAVAFLGFAAILTARLAGGGSIDLPWAPTLDLRLSFSLDGLGALYALLATGIGFAVFVYARDYLPIHLRHQGRAEHESGSFYLFLLLFMGAMVGLATAGDLILLFVFWDLTAIASYYLIGFDRQDAKDRYAALQALLVTGTSAVLLLIGALVLRDRYGTFALAEILPQVEGDTATTTAAVLIAVAALAKSAQVPFHFWLPRAMVAPTPVSAYLHSAAMVAAGVFLLSRVYPLLAAAPHLLDALLAAGIASMAIGGVLALTRQELKDVLAYSTIAQYGYVVFLLGLGTEAGVAAACFYVIVHAIAKCALFLTAGAVTVTTGENRLSHLGGLAREMPLVTAGSAVAAAGIVALPGTVGFFADELFFTAALDRSPLLGAVAVASAGLTFAYLGRFWAGIFLGPRRPAEAEPVSLALRAPIAGLGLVLLVLGVVTEPVTRLAAVAAEAALLGPPVDVDVAYHLDLRSENLMALSAFALGLGALATRRRWWPAAVAAARLGARAGPDRLYRLVLAGLNGLSDRIHDIEVRDLRTRVAAVFVPAALLVFLGVAATPTAGAYELGSIASDDVGLVVVLAVAALGALATAFPRNHVTLVLVLSSVGFSLAVAYAFFGGPDVALVAVLIETVLALAFLGVLSLLPRDLLRREAQVPTSRGRRWRDPLVGVIAGGGAFVVAWGALSRPAPQESAATEIAELAPEAHAADVVTAILADFRGLDTLVEITVLAVAVLGVVTLVRGQRA